MSHKRRFVAVLRPELNFAYRWELRSSKSDAWLPVFYSTPKEANAAIDAMSAKDRHGGDATVE